MNQRDKKRSATRQTKVSSLKAPASSLNSAWFLAGLLTSLSAPTLAQDGPQLFAVPAQALSDALTELADQADLKLVSDAALLRRLPSPGVSGTLTPSVLAGTGMRHRFVDADTVTIERAPKASPPPEPLAQATPPPEPEEEVVTLPPITVTAKPWDDTSYNVQDATTATKTDTPIMETPVNIQVVPKAVLDDQQVIQLAQAVKNVSGVVTSQGSGGLSDDIFLRGFRTSTYFPQRLPDRQRILLGGYAAAGECGTYRSHQRARLHPLRPHGTRRHGQRDHQAAVGDAVLFPATAIRIFRLVSYRRRRHRTDHRG